MRALGIYREKEFSPGKVDADAAILDSVLAELRHAGFGTFATEPAELGSWSKQRFDVVLAMCQSEDALDHLSEMERAGALSVTPALSIRNCYRDRLGARLAKAGAPVPAGALVETSTLHPGSSSRLGISPPLYVKRGDLHALCAEDVRRVDGVEELRLTLESFARRGIRQAYLQEAVEGVGVKFYGVSGEYFSALPEHDELSSTITLRLAEAAAAAAAVIGLEAWGGDAVIDRRGVFKLIDFNDWPSYSRVREEAARAIARRAAWLVRRVENRLVQS
jgi:hypothetical protein